MHLDEIDGELHILDENLDVVHVFERARSSDANGEVTLSRAAYKHMYDIVIFIQNVKFAINFVEVHYIFL